MHYIFSNYLKLYMLLSENDLLALNALKEKDFQKILQEKTSKQNKAQFSECFQNFIKNHENKIFLNKLTEKDINKFLNDKKSLSKKTS